MEPVRVGRHEFAKVTVYRDEIEQYYTFCSPECYRYLLEYRSVREKAGEAIRPMSPLVRDEWGNYRMAGDPANAKAITSKTLRDQLARLYNRPNDGFSWTYIATQAQSSSPQQVGRSCMRVLDRTKKLLDLIYANQSNPPDQTASPGNPYQGGVPS